MDTCLIVLGTTVVGLMVMTGRRISYKKVQYLANWTTTQIQFNVVSWKLICADLLRAKRGLTELPRTPDRIAVVTGGSRGIGAEVVRTFLQCRMEVVIACRNTSAGEKVIRTIRESGVQTGKASVMELDNSSLNSVKKFCEEFYHRYEKLDILINNAGVMFVPYKRTEDNFEQHYEVNYLSHFFLTLLMIPALKNASTSERSSRIVNVSSCVHRAGTINFDDFFNNEEYFDEGAAYLQSKLAQVMSTKSFARLFEKRKLPIKTHAVHPGIVSTDLFFHEHTYLRYLKFMRNIFLRTPAQGTMTIIYAALSPEIEGKTGLYLDNCQESTMNSLADDEALQDRLFQCSLKQVQLESITT